VSRSFDTAALISLGVFAYGCNLDEHVRYGMCLDGKCAQRSSWETVRWHLSQCVRLGPRVRLHPVRGFTPPCFSLSVDGCLDPNLFCRWALLSGGTCA